MSNAKTARCRPIYFLSSTPPSISTISLYFSCNSSLATFDKFAARATLSSVCISR